MKNFKGVIIEEGLKNKDVLQKVKIIRTDIEQVIEKHKTPWIKQWILHTVEVFEDKADDIAKELSKSLDSEHNWYADYKNDYVHYVVFCNKVFKVDRSKIEEYKEVVKYGLSLDIPDYQLGFVKYLIR